MKKLENIFELYHIYDLNGKSCNLLETDLGKELLEDVKRFYIENECGCWGRYVCNNCRDEEE